MGGSALETLLKHDQLATGIGRPLNIALHRPATQSSTSPWSTDQNVETDARVANNGDLLSSRWFHTAHEVRPWWQVDLGSLFLVKRVVIHNRPDFRERLSDFTLLRSHDGKDWIEFCKNKDRVSFETLSMEITGDCLARFVRVRLNGAGVLHFRECEIFGEPARPEEEDRLLAQDAEVLRARTALPEGRNGHLSQVGDFDVFVDVDNYAGTIRRALDSGDYEGRERRLALEFLRPDDRVIEAGTAVGVVAMTAASIVGASNVITFDANPEIIVDARDNFRRNGLQDIKSNLGILACRQNFTENSEIDFYIAKEFWESRLGARADAPDIIKVVRIPVFCLEHEIASHNANVLICDIEGGEVELLAHADLSGIRLIIMETHYWAAGEAATDAMIRNLILQGFSFHLAASGGQISVLRRH
jgi:FkbM family methyltransferase